jgi:hypothetical protein
MSSHSRTDSAGVRKTVSSTRIRRRRRPAQAVVAMTSAVTAASNARKEAVLVGDRRAARAEWVCSGRDRALRHGRDRQTAEYRVDVPRHARAVPLHGVRLHSGGSVDARSEPAGDGGDASAGPRGRRPISRTALRSAGRRTYCAIGSKFSERPMMWRITSLEPARIRCTRVSRHSRVISYSFM